MATLQELRGLFSNSDLMEKVESALIIAVQAILDGSPTSDDRRYSAHVFDSPHAEAKKALMGVLASNKAATPGQITGAADTTIQTNVNNVVGTLSAAWIAANPTGV